MLELCNDQYAEGRGRSVKSPREHMEIVNAYALVGSYRGAAALCGTTHKTVKRVVSRRTAAQRQPREVVRNTAIVEALIADRVRASDGRITAKRLLPIVAAAGYTGSAGGGRGQVGVETPAADLSPVGAGARRAPGDRLGDRSRSRDLLRGAGMEPLSLRALRR